MAADPARVGCQKSAHHAAHSYSWISPPRTSRRRSSPRARPSLRWPHAEGTGVARSRLRCGRCWLQGRPGARCPPFDEPVSRDRPPNPACQSSRHRALHQARYQQRLCCRSAPQYPPWTASPTPVFTGGSCPADTPPQPRCALRHVHTAGVLGLLRALRHDPPPPADDAPARRPMAGEGGDGSLPTTTTTTTTTRSTRSVPALPGSLARVRRSPSPWPPRPATTNRLRSRPPPRRACTADRPTSARFGAGTSLTEPHRWFLAYPSRLACRTRTVWQCRPVPASVNAKGSTSPGFESPQLHAWPQGCANAFMQLGGTHGADHRAGRVDEGCLGDPRRQDSARRLGPAPQAGAPGADDWRCNAGRRPRAPAPGARA